ncbi:MAG: large-conductance mechanosensitive channel protein MscL [Lachnospiraceae bacterium]|nr:large-conductance mechanosensitive channel protein MscL [Lachnospiraceae bacterium]
MKSFMKEFKEFISKGNVMDMAVGIIIGGAFTAIVTSLVDDVIMPVISLLTGGFDFSALCVVLGEGEGAATLNYGAFIAAIVNFLIIAIVIFCLIKSINKFKRKQEEAPTTKDCPYCFEKINIKATKCPHCGSEVK